MSDWYAVGNYPEYIDTGPDFPTIGIATIPVIEMFITNQLVR